MAPVPLCTRAEEWRSKTKGDCYTHEPSPLSATERLMVFTPIAADAPKGHRRDRI